MPKNISILLVCSRNLLFPEECNNKSVKFHPSMLFVIMGNAKYLNVALSILLQQLKNSLKSQNMNKSALDIHVQTHVYVANFK